VDSELDPMPGTRRERDRRQARPRPAPPRRLRPAGHAGPHRGSFRGTPTTPADVQGLENPTWNAQLGTFPAPGTTNPPTVFNVPEPEQHGALGNVKVRQALEYAIDKGLSGRSTVAAIPQPAPQSSDRTSAEGFVLFNGLPHRPTTRATWQVQVRSSRRGYPNGITLKGLLPATAATQPGRLPGVQSDFQKCGVTVVGTPSPPATTAPQESA